MFHVLYLLCYVLSCHQEHPTVALLRLIYHPKDLQGEKQGEAEGRKLKRRHPDILQ